MAKKQIIIGLILTVCVNTTTSFAATTTPQRMIYEARLLDSSGSNPLTANHTFRFSFWSQSAVDTGDISSGTINTGAPNYAGWQEVQSTLPSTNGFVTFELGSVTSLPQIDSTQHLYLQVEVKESGDPDTAYEVLDREPANPLIDRAPIGSVPYALNADTIDNAEIGLNDGDIALLSTGGIFPIQTIPGGTNEDVFILDQDDSSTTSIELQFGNSLGKIFSWDLVNGYFNFNDDVNIEGDLTLTGTVDGVDVGDLGTTVNNHLDGGASKHDASEIDVEATDGNYYSAGDLETAIDDIDQAIASVSTGPVSESIILDSQFEGASYIADGTNNIGRLYLDNDSTAKENFYEWKSTLNTLQDYDIVLQVGIPKTFTGWESTNPWQFNYRSSSANNSTTKADIFIYDTNGNPVTLTGTSTNLASTSWAQTNLNFSGTPTFTAGESFLIIVRLYAKDSETMNLGEIKLNYKG
jgi:hypothetical protein